MESTPQSPPTAGLVFRFLSLAFLCIYGWKYFTMSMRELGEEGDSFLHGANLIIHEAGHVIFKLFGNDLLYYLGGSVFQVLLPGAIAIAFIVKNKDYAGSAIFFWWSGQNLVDVAPYINDARMLSLPLLGGGNGREVEGHDWEFILTELELLGSDITIARSVLLIGRIVMASSLAGGFACIVCIFLRQLNRKRSQKIHDHIA